MNRTLWTLAAISVWTASGCNPRPILDSDPEPEAPVFGPELVHVAPEGASEGTDLVLVVQATDPEGVDEVVGFFRIAGTAAWTRVPLTAGDADWSVTIPGSMLSFPGVEYYFRAQDASDLHTPSFLPVDDEEAPFEVPVSVVGRTLPFEEGFEGAGTGGLYALGWNEFSSGFPGAPWGLTSLRASGGTTSVEHARGAQGVAVLSDWLVSPPLSFASEPTVEVRWSEYGDFADTSTHSLWISTTNPDPTAPGNGFVKVADLDDPPEDAWGRSAIVDLTAYSGAATVWLAWRYDGQYSDLWAIDDVIVRALGPDVVAGEPTVDVSPVDPGGAASVSIALENLGAVATGALTVEFLDDAETAAFTLEAAQPALEPGAPRQITASLALAPEHPDNQWLPFTVRVSDGVDTWLFPRRILVGHPSEASFDIKLYSPGLLKLTLGVGDVAAPRATWPVVAEVSAAGEKTFEVDLSASSDELPPGPAEGRFWVKVEAGAAGSLDAFELSFDGETFSGDDLGAFTDAEPRWFFLPSPPELVLESSSTSPATVRPGDRVAWTAQFRNVGATTTGPTVARLVSDDPDVSVVSAPLDLGEDWPSSAGIRSTFAFDVAPSHVNSRPVALRLELADAAETVSVPISVDVPWPVLQVVSVRLDDEDGGDDDGLLEAGEEAQLTVTVANVGARSTFAGVTCDLEAVAGPIEIVTARDSFGVIGVAATKDANDYVIRAGTGEVGTPLTMRLDCTDGTAVYDVPVELVLGEAPWLALSTVRDASDDAVSDYGFDLLGGRYRVVSDVLQIQLDAAAPFTAEGLFLEAWMESLGADYWNYQVIVQSGVAKLRGYRGSFTTLVSPTYAEIDDDTVQIGLDLVSMGLSLDEIAVGFAAGFCGGDDYYCDQFPDGWGNPYRTGLLTDQFVELRW